MHAEGLDAPKLLLFLVEKPHASLIEAEPRPEHLEHRAHEACGVAMEHALLGHAPEQLQVPLPRFVGGLLPITNPAEDR